MTPYFIIIQWPREIIVFAAQQPLRIDGPERTQDDVALYGRLMRDICYLYHELSAYRHIVGDLDYASDYPLEYWTLLNRVDTGRGDDRFIRGGILVMLLAMLRDAFDDSGNYVVQHAAAISQQLARFVPEDDEMLRLVETVERGMSLLSVAGRSDDRFDADLCWAYDTFVRRYFAGSAL